MRNACVIGAGGHAKVVIRTLQEAGYVVDAAFDDDPHKRNTLIAGVPVVGPVSDADRTGPRPAVIAVGNNAQRRRIAETLGCRWLTVVHPSATVDATAALGNGVVVFAGVVIQADAVIGDHAIVNSSAVVDHDCVVERFAHVGPAACLTGGVRIGEGAFIGAGAVVVPGKRICGWATVGAGAVVVEDVDAPDTVVGVPARALGPGGGRPDGRRQQ